PAAPREGRLALRAGSAAPPAAVPLAPALLRPRGGGGDRAGSRARVGRGRARGGRGDAHRRNLSRRSRQPSSPSPGAGIGAGFARGRTSGSSNGGREGPDPGERGGDLAVLTARCAAEIGSYVWVRGIGSAEERSCWKKGPS